ncbi:MAG: helix-turn-helix domain-containing protein [Propioniciclava sp.]
MIPAAHHHGNLRSVLLAQAEVALRQVGVDGLSLRQIARDLGVNHGTPARHFRDKQALLDALTLDGYETLNTQRGRHRRHPSGALRGDGARLHHLRH